MTSEHSGRLCFLCGQNLARMITRAASKPFGGEMGLDTRPPSSGGVRSKRPPGSPSLIRLEVLSLASNSWVESYRRPDGQFVLESIDVRGALEEWARCLVTDAGGFYYNGAWTLTTHHDALIRQPWVDECYIELVDICKLLDRIEGAASPRRIGTCDTRWFVGDPPIVPEPDEPDPDHGIELVVCGGPLYAPPLADRAPEPDGRLVHHRNDRIQCRRCGRRYSGRDLLRLENEST